MAFTFPRTILDDEPVWSTDFFLNWRQEQSTTTGGRTIVKNFGSSLWSAAFQSIILKPNDLDRWRAILDSLENGIQTFIGRSKSRCYPIAYPNGSWPTGGAFNGVGTLSAIAGNRKEINLSGFPAGFVLNPGDMVTINNRDLHRVMNVVTASGAGVLTNVEVRPHIWPGVVTAVPTTVHEPFCVMAIVPGSIVSASGMNGRGTIGFQGYEARP